MNLKAIQVQRNASPSGRSEIATDEETIETVHEIVMNSSPVKLKEIVEKVQCQIDAESLIEQNRVWITIAQLCSFYILQLQMKRQSKQCTKRSESIPKKKRKCQRQNGGSYKMSIISEYYFITWSFFAFKRPLIVHFLRYIAQHIYFSSYAFSMITAILCTKSIIEYLFLK